MLRGHESLQRFYWQCPPVSPRQEHGSHEQVCRTHRSSIIQRYCVHGSDSTILQTGRAFYTFVSQTTVDTPDTAHTFRTRGYSLYLRPTLIGTQRTLGVGPPASALLYLIASPVGPYYPSGFKAISLLATSSAVRAWPGGVGDRKLGANYAPCIVPQMQAAAKGFHQNLWLFKEGDEEYVTEAGTMNLFVAFKKKNGNRELITAPLDGTILEGVTRDSILALARERLEPEGWTISERKFSMRELKQWADDGNLLEVFGAGTAAVVSPVRSISWQGQLIDCGLKEGEEVGEVTNRMKGWMEGIQYGNSDHPWRYVCFAPCMLRTLTDALPVYGYRGSALHCTCICTTLSETEIMLGNCRIICRISISLPRPGEV